MSKRGIQALRDALTGPLGAHLDDETLANIVTAEAVGEDVERSYAQALRHIERCERCAEAYGELAEMMFAAIADMDSVAEAVAAEKPSGSGIWGRAVSVVSSMSEGWHRLQLALLPPAVEPVLGTPQSGLAEAAWLLFRRTVGTPLPLTVEAWAEPQDALTCRLVVQVDRPGLADPSGRGVQIRFRNRQATATTDPNGMVSFDSIPISAVADLSIEVAAD